MKLPWRLITAKPWKVGKPQRFCPGLLEPFASRFSLERSAGVATAQCGGRTFKALGEVQTERANATAERRAVRRRNPPALDTLQKKESNSEI